MTSTTTAPPRTPTRSFADPSPAPQKKKRSRIPLLLIVPTVVLLIAALGYPVGWQVVTSFQHFGMLQQFGQPPEWVGFDNYKALLTDSNLWVIVGRSIAFCIVCALLTVAVGLGLALLMRAVNTPARLILQIALLFAWAMPVVASMTVWVWLVDWRRGLLHWLLACLVVDA